MAIAGIVIGVLIGVLAVFLRADGTFSQLKNEESCFKEKEIITKEQKRHSQGKSKDSG